MPDSPPNGNLADGPVGPCRREEGGDEADHEGRKQTGDADAKVRIAADKDGNGQEVRIVAPQDSTYTNKRGDVGFTQHG